MRLSCSTNRIHPAGRTFLYGLLLWVMAAQSAELGRLFTTPQERAMLEKSRHRPTPQVEKQPKRIEKEPRGSAVEEIKAPPRITINGVVSRTDGTSTVWVNGMNSLEDDLDAQHIYVDPTSTRGEKVTIRLPNSPLELRLKPGETYEPSASTVIDGYQHKH
jgi:hypothetical protein